MMTAPSPEHAAPFFFPLLLLLGFLAMCAVSVHGFMEGPDTVASSAPNAKSGDTADAAPSVTAGSPGGPASSLTEQQADDLSGQMRAIQNNPNDADALMRIGETFLMAKDWNRAEVFLGRAVLSRPSDTRPRSLLGICLYQQKKMREAAKVFEELLEIGNDPAAQYNLAIIYKYHLDKKNEAISLFERIAALPDADPDTATRARKELQE